MSSSHSPDGAAFRATMRCRSDVIAAVHALTVRFAMLTERPPVRYSNSNNPQQNPADSTDQRDSTDPIPYDRSEQAEQDRGSGEEPIGAKVGCGS